MWPDSASGVENASTHLALETLTEYLVATAYDRETVRDGEVGSFITSFE